MAVDTIDVDVQDGQDCGEAAPAFAPEVVRRSFRLRFAISLPNDMALERTDGRNGRRTPESRKQARVTDSPLEFRVQLLLDRRPNGGRADTSDGKRHDSFRSTGTDRDVPPNR